MKCVFHLLYCVTHINFLRGTGMTSSFPFICIGLHILLEATSDTAVDKRSKRKNWTNYPIPSGAEKIFSMDSCLSSYSQLIFLSFNFTKSSMKLLMTLIFPKWGPDSRERRSLGHTVCFRHQVGGAASRPLAGGLGFAIVDTHLMPLFWQDIGYWQLSGKTGSSRNQSGHRVSGGDSRAQRPSVRQGAWQLSPGTGLYLRYLHTCA